MQTGRTSPPFLPQTRPRAYSSDLEDNTNVWKDALGRYALKTRVRAKEVETVWREFEDVSFAFLLGPEHSLNRVFPQNRKSLVAQQARERYAVRLVGIMNRARSQARARPFHSLRVGSDASDEEIDQLAGGGDVWDDVVDAPASIQADDSPKKGQLPVKVGRDDELDPDEAANENAPPLSLSAPDSTMLLSTTSGAHPPGVTIPKRAPPKKRKGDASATATPGSASNAAGTSAGVKLSIFQGAVGTNARRNGRAGVGKAGGQISIKDWPIPYPELEPMPIGVIPPSLPPTALTFADIHFEGTSGSRDYQETDKLFNDIWKKIISEGVPWAFASRSNNVTAHKLVAERTAKWCASAAKRGWGGPHPASLLPHPNSGVTPYLTTPSSSGRFGRDAIAKVKRVQKELSGGFWKRSEKEERDERRRREKEAVDRVRAENEKREEMRQRRKLEFLITQTELYSHFVGKRLKSMSSAPVQLYCTYLSFVASTLEQEDPDSTQDVADDAEQAVGEVDLEHDDLDQIEEEDIDFDKGLPNRNPG